MRLFLLISLVACKQETEPTYDQYNADGDELSVEVGAADLLDLQEIELHSSTGEVIVGLATLDPGGGPVGTEHDIVVEIYEEYASTVDRTTVRTDSPDRGEDEYDFDIDSASEGLYKLSLVSVGADDEVRTDTLTIRLWDLEEDE